MTIASQATASNTHYPHLTGRLSAPSAKRPSRYCSHLQLQWHDCQQAAESLRDAETLKRLCLRLCEETGLRVTGNAFFQFSPGGVTGTLMLDDAHIAIHTWPERNMLKAEVTPRRRDGEAAVLQFMAHLQACFQPLSTGVKQRRSSAKLT